MYIKHKLGKSTFKGLIFYATKTGNTKDIVQHVAEVLECEISDVNKIAYPDISNIDVIGFASGVYNGEIDPRMLEVIERMEFREDQYVFLVLTHAKSLNDRYVAKLEKIFKDKGVYFLGTTDALGADRQGNAGFLGRGAQKHPNENDYYRVENFAVDVIYIVNRLLGNTERESEITATSERKTKLPIDLGGAMPKFMKSMRIDE